jgi:hypothetical protein
LHIKENFKREVKERLIIKTLQGLSVQSLLYKIKIIIINHSLSEIYLLETLTPVSGTYPVSYLMTTGGLFQDIR